MAKKMNSITADEARWRAESDMRILKDAELIRADKARVRAAASMARKEAKALARVAGKTARGKR